MKEVNQENLAECIKRLRAISRYNHPITDRIDTLLLEQAQRHDAWVDACENRINSLEAERRWIPVEERLPTRQDADAEGYVWVSAIRILTATRSNDSWLWSQVSLDGGTDYKPTHWQRITPPEGV
jgi:hypothetical protein